MPFKSEAQRRFMWAKHPQMAREFQDATPKDADLPEHVKSKKATMEKTAEPPPPEGVSVKDWDRHLSEGGRVEMEHEGTIKKIKARPDIPVEVAANSIGKEHTDEFKDYYTRLARMENELEAEKKAAFWDELSKISEEQLTTGQRIRKAAPMVGGLVGAGLGLRSGLRGGNVLKKTLGGAAAGATVGWAPDVIAGGVEGIRGRA